jgi:hypothetical protein
MAKPKLNARIREALDKGGWQEYVSTTRVLNYRRPLSTILIQPSPTHKGRYAVMIEYLDVRPNVYDGMDEDTLIKHLTQPDKE